MIINYKINYPGNADCACTKLLQITKITKITILDVITLLLSMPLSPPINMLDDDLNLVQPTSLVQLQILEILSIDSIILTVCFRD